MLNQGIKIVVVDGTFFRTFEVTYNINDQLTQAEAESVRDFFLDLYETKYSQTGLSVSAELYTISAV